MSKNFPPPTPEAAQKIVDTLHARAWNSRSKTYGWKPHPGQVKVGKALLVDGKKRGFVSCGRKWGKTEFVIYLLVRWAILHPESTCAYFGPTRTLARTILWKRLKTFIPKEFLLNGSVEGAFKEQTMTVRLWNGSEIQVDGTTDEDSGRGVEPHLVVYDEYKDHKPGFHGAMEPNLEVHKALVVFIGTPPDHENHFTEMVEEIKGDPEAFYIEAPSEEGPVYGTPDGLKALAKIEARCIARGDHSYFIREYKGRFVIGGSNSIFPMWNRETLTVDEEKLRDHLKRDLGKLEWYVVTDPGSTTCHATLVTALNPYTKAFYILDEIYEKNPIETSTRRIWPRIETLMQKWRPNVPISDAKWYKGYDSAAAWFRNEVNDSFGNIGLSPTNKHLVDKVNGLSLIKDQMLEGKITVNAACTNLIWEIERYVKDKNGNIPKKDDHLIDVLRYINSASGYHFEQDAETLPDPLVSKGWRGTRATDEHDLDHFIDDDGVSDY